MSRIANNPIKISKEVVCTFIDGIFSAKGKLGQMQTMVNSNYKIHINDDQIKVIPNTENNKDPNWGTTRAIIANIINGVTNGFTKTLELNGTGYRAIPADIKIECPKQNLIKLTSINKEKLGAAAAKIRSFRKPEPFKGKGIKYIDEYIFRKEGKKK